MPGFTNIIEVNLLEASKFHINVFDKIHQWDTGIKLHFSGIVLPAGTVCQFDTKTTSYNVALNLTDMTCDVPNLAIGEDLKGDLTCHLKVSTEDYGIVVFDIVIPTIRRQKPSNYIYSDNIQHIDEWISGQVVQFQQENKYFVITEDIVTVEQDSVYGVAPYSTSYYHTNITINENAGIRWVEGGLYQFVVNTSMVVDSQHRNVRVRIGPTGDWKPLMDSADILVGVNYFVKSQIRCFSYTSKYQTNGALHMITDSNTTYSHLDNYVHNNTIKVDQNGYAASQSLLFATTPLTNPTDERYSSLVSSQSAGTTKTVVTPASGKFYIDRIPYFYYASNQSAGQTINNAGARQWQHSMDIRYSVNTSSTYLTAAKKCFLWLKDFDESDMSFKADATVGNIMTVDKLATRFPSSSYATPLYLYYLGCTSSAYNLIDPNIVQDIKIYKYYPSTGYLEPFFPGQKHLYEHELAFTLNDTLSHIYFSIAVKIITEESETILSGSTVKAKLASIYQCKTLQDFFSKYSEKTYKLPVYWSYVDSTQISGQNNKPAICTGMTVSNSGDVVFSYVMIASTSSAAPISKWNRNLTDSEILVTNLNETITQLL